MDQNTCTSRIVQLAATISLSVAKIQNALDEKGLPSPSFDENAPPLPGIISEAQSVVLDATAELHDLLTDPMSMIHRSTRV